MQGQQYDEESGLHYNLHRYYDPTIGRYITQDPIGLRGGWNFYDYPLDPLKIIDSLGLASTKLDGNKIQVHNNDVDPWPSKPHGHIYYKNQVIDKMEEYSISQQVKKYALYLKNHWSNGQKFLGRLINFH